MVKKVDLKHVGIAETGTFGIDAFRENQKSIQEVINENANELKALSQHRTETISFGIEHSGKTTILNGGKHGRGLITNAFATCGDNLSKEITVTIKGVTDTQKFSATEKAGKIKIFDIQKKSISFHEDVIVETNSDRKIMVNITLESAEGEDE